MYKVTVMNPCSCFIKKGYVDTQDFATKEAAKNEAQYLLDDMERTFCQKHQFSMIEQFGNYTIYIKPKS